VTMTVEDQLNARLSALAEAIRTLRDQAPRGGCVNCGNPVRTRKSGLWLCYRCHRRGVR
jgi:hypothetical protein